MRHDITVDRKSFGQQDSLKETQKTQKNKAGFTEANKGNEGDHFPGTGRTPAGEVGSSCPNKKSRVPPHRVFIIRAIRVIRGHLVRSSLPSFSSVHPHSCIFVQFVDSPRSLRLCEVIHDLRSYSKSAGRRICGRSRRKSFTGRGLEQAGSTK